MVRVTPQPRCSRWAQRQQWRRAVYDCDLHPSGGPLGARALFHSCLIRSAPQAIAAAAGSITFSDRQTNDNFTFW